MIVRDKLSAEMVQLSTDSKWEEYLQEMINELLMMGFFKTAEHQPCFILI